MGWVEEIFRTEDLLRTGKLRLWNTLRDSVGEAVMEFNRYYPDKAVGEPSDCSAHAVTHCCRIHQPHGNNAIELFLSENTQLLQAYTTPPGELRQICRYRVDLQNNCLTFSDDEGRVVSASEACRKALYVFLFPPR